MVEFRNWDRGRVGVNIKYKDPLSGLNMDKSLILPNRITTDIKFNYEPIHGLNEWNVGVKELPPEFTFVLALPVVSPHVRMLRQLHVTGLPFDLVLADESTANPDLEDVDGVFAKTKSNEFGLLREELIEARVTTKELNIVVDDVPMVVFTGFSLRYTYNDKLYFGIGAGTTAQKGIQFGDGAPISPASGVNIFAEWAPVGAA